MKNRGMRSEFQEKDNNEDGEQESQLAELQRIVDKLIEECNKLKKKIDSLDN